MPSRFTAPDQQPILVVQYSEPYGFPRISFEFNYLSTHWRDKEQTLSDYHRPYGDEDDRYTLESLDCALSLEAGRYGEEAGKVKSYWFPLDFSRGGNIPELERRLRTLRRMELGIRHQFTDHGITAKTIDQYLLQACAVLGVTQAAVAPRENDARPIISHHVLVPIAQLPAEIERLVAAFAEKRGLERSATSS
jgi:hypothetical protein